MNVEQRALAYPLGELAMRIFLWLLSVLALYGAFSLIVLRPSLVSTSASSLPLESAKADNSEGLEGAVCSFPNLTE